MIKSESEKLKRLYEAYLSVGDARKSETVRYKKIKAAIEFSGYADKLKARRGLDNKDLAAVLGCKEWLIKYIKQRAANGKRVKVENFDDLQALKEKKKEKINRYIAFLRKMERSKNG